MVVSKENRKPSLRQLTDDRHRLLRVWSWGLYDFANSPFAAIITTFVFPAYFVSVLADDKSTGTTQWAYAQAAAALCVALTVPFLGQWADRNRWRKNLLMISTWVCAAASAVLWFAVPGQNVIMVLAVVALATIAFEIGTSFYNSMLDDTTKGHGRGKISGFSWAGGYAGGLLALIVVLVLFIQADNPLFGLIHDDYGSTRIAGPMVALWLLLFSIPLWLWGNEDTKKESTLAPQTWRQIFSYLWQSHGVGRLNWGRFLIARMIYADGLATIFSFGGIYAAAVFGFSLEEILLFGIAMNAGAGFGALVFAPLDDRIGSGRLIQISLMGLFVTALGVVLASTKMIFVIFALALSVGIGPVQSASRSLMAAITPPELRGSGFGLYALSGKATSFIGPLAVGSLVALTGSERLALSVVVVMFGLALVVFWPLTRRHIPTTARQGH